ncbi:sensor histidine kinase [Gottfriedia solisilvae]|uniref:sensor histidine kinase n=1 Tax=Gottfriedia solisilvae TaxID=1516104 RepID=UPI003D2EE1D6
MKTLYVRIVMTTIFVMIFSGLVSFLISNIYYHYKLKPYNDQKLTRMANEVKSFYEKNPSLTIQDYLENVGDLGYQVLLVDENEKQTFYGGSFKKSQLDGTFIESVLNGKVYHGIAQYPTSWFVTGFFDNSVVNTIGVPINHGKNHYALFLRPNVELQFGELRILFSIILGLTILLSIVMVFISTRYIVKPIVKLTEATKIIAEGKYKIRLQIKRKDEIGKLANHFTKMTKKLDQIEQMRQEFVSNVSHEFQSPLTSIQGFSQSLQADDLTDEQRKTFSSIIEKESKRMSLLSKQLLVLASLDKEEEILQKTEYDVAEQIKQIIVTNEWSWRTKNLAIEMELAPTNIFADKNLLHQAWTNLIMNSIKFNKEGGLISVRLSNEHDMVTIEIKDTGIGISENDLPYIFNRFYIADKARIRKESSTGLGLAITKQIIELHNGEIHVESKLNEGSLFLIKIPQM